MLLSLLRSFPVFLPREGEAFTYQDLAHIECFVPQRRSPKGQSSKRAAGAVLPPAFNLNQSALEQLGETLLSLEPCGQLPFASRA
jgi:hypothetical protein